MKEFKKKKFINRLPSQNNIPQWRFSLCFSLFFFSFSRRETTPFWPFVPFFFHELENSDSLFLISERAFFPSFALQYSLARANQNEVPYKYMQTHTHTYTSAYVRTYISITLDTKRYINHVYIHVYTYIYKVARARAI